MKYSKLCGYKIHILLAIISISSLILNYIMLNTFNSKILEKESLKNTNTIVENTQILTNDELKDFNYTELLDLANLYYAQQNYEKSKEIADILLEKYNAYNWEVLGLLSAINEYLGNFDLSIKYTLQLIPLASNIQLPDLYNKLANYYLLIDFNESIKYLELSNKLINDSSYTQQYPSEKEYYNKKMAFFLDLKVYYTENNIKSYYETIINDSEFKDIPETIKEEMQKKYTLLK